MANHTVPVEPLLLPVSVGAPKYTSMDVSDQGIMIEFVFISWQDLKPVLADAILNHGFMSLVGAVLRDLRDK